MRLCIYARSYTHSHSRATPRGAACSRSAGAWPLFLPRGLQLPHQIGHRAWRLQDAWGSSTKREEPLSSTHCARRGQRTAAPTDHCARHVRTQPSPHLRAPRAATPAMCTGGRAPLAPTARTHSSPPLALCRPRPHTLHAAAGLQSRVPQTCGHVRASERAACGQGLTQWQRASEATHACCTRPSRPPRALERRARLQPAAPEAVRAHARGQVAGVREHLPPRRRCPDCAGVAQGLIQGRGSVNATRGSIGHERLAAIHLREREQRRCIACLALSAASPWPPSC